MNKNNPEENNKIMMVEEEKRISSPAPFYMIGVGLACICLALASHFCSHPATSLEDDYDWNVLRTALVSAMITAVIWTGWSFMPMKKSIGNIPYITSYPPQGRSWPILGQVYNFLQYRPWDLLMDWHKLYGPIVCFPLLGQTMVSVAQSPLLLKAVLQSQIASVKKDVAGTMKPFLSILGTGIVSSEGKHWMQQRLKMSHPLRQDILQIIPKQTLAAVKRLMNKMDEITEQQEQTEQKLLPLGSSLRHLTLQVISGSFLSLSAEESDSTFAKLYLPIVDESNDRVWHPYRTYMFVLPAWWKYHANVYRLNQYVSSLIRQRWQLRRSEQAERNKLDANNKTNNTTREQDVLDMMLKVYEKDTDHIPQTLPDGIVRQVRDEIKTFMLAGHETSAAMMTWALYELILNKHHNKLANSKVTLEEQLITEANQVFSPTMDWKTATETAIPSNEELSKLAFSEACLKESLRKYSVVPTVARRTVEEMHLQDESGKTYHIPSNTQILINIQSCHMDPKVWPEPKTYNPHRFLTTATPIAPFTFLPFIAGPRNCLGQHLALLESKMVISLLTQRYDLTLPDDETSDWYQPHMDPRHRYTVPVIPKEDLMVSVKRRK